MPSYAILKEVSKEVDVMFKWVDDAIQRMRWWDISMVKLSTAAFVLMIAKFWPGLLSLDWYWYLIVALVAAYGPMMKMFRCGK